MNHSDATMLVAKLEAAFPLPKVPGTTLALYAEELAQLGSAEIAQQAVQALIRTSPRWPSLADLHSTYRRIALRRQEQAERERRALEEADPRTPEHARETLRRLEGVEGPFAEQVRLVLRRVAARSER